MLTLVLLVVASLANNNLHKLPNVDMAWEKWNVIYKDHELLSHPVYTSGMNADRRYNVFAEHYAVVKMHNSLANQTFTMELNHFATISNEEFASIYNGYDHDLKKTLPPNTEVRSEHDGSDLPDSVDWRDQNRVTAVKNQESCGSCWAFSTVVSLEGQFAAVTGNLVSLSEQDIVDCVKKQKIPGSSDTCCDGCQGGLMDYAFQYMLDSQGGEDETELVYGYTGRDGRCNFANKKAYSDAKITKYTDVQKGTDNLAEAVANVGPISVAVNANTFWQLYSSGVLDPLACPGSKLDHGVAAVGYGTDSGKDYWIIKNSWGKTWGEKGYVRLLKGKNTCGVQNGPPSYPTATKN